MSSGPVVKGSGKVRSMLVKKLISKLENFSHWSVGFPSRVGLNYLMTILVVQRYRKTVRALRVIVLVPRLCNMTCAMPQSR